MPGGLYTPGMHLLMAGNPVEGFSFYGPFESEEQADEWVESHDEIDATDYWIIEVQPPGDIHQTVGGTQ